MSQTPSLFRLQDARAFFAALLAMLLAFGLGPNALQAKEKTPATDDQAVETAPLASGLAPATLPDAGIANSGKLVPLALSAVMGTEEGTISSGLIWRVFAVDPSNEQLKEVARSLEAAPRLSLPAGAYVVHAAYGLGSTSRRISLGRNGNRERLSLPVGAISVRGQLNDKPIDPSDLSIAIYIPSEISSEEQLVTDKLKSGELLRLPEGTYHVVSTFGASNASVRADIQVRTGKAIDVLMRHRAARITLKLVSKAGGESLANTEWTVLTPGGDLVKEELGAFPSVVLAEGAYTAIARHDGQTYVSEIKVVSGPDKDVEVIAANPQ
jgi:hypothetical protein